jgi:hypothetical protein
VYSRLLGLREQRLLVPSQQMSKSSALLTRHTQAIKVKNGGRSGQQDNSIGQRDLAVEGSGASKQTIVTNHGHFDHLSVRKADDQ